MTIPEILWVCVWVAALVAVLVPFVAGREPK